MPQLRLIGLVLFITSIFLALAAIATQTSHLKVKRPSPPTPAEGTAAEEVDTATHADDTDLEPIPVVLHFASVPMAIPIALAGLIGLILWFAPAPRRATSKTRRKRKRRRK
ncbi:MAG: hypothetical protein KDA45_07620 [Planctomycetales bacterium]|nr:hypothetical protein [Planctomycetales bacterium]